MKTPLKGPWPPEFRREKRILRFMKLRHISREEAEKVDAERQVIFALSKAERAAHWRRLLLAKPRPHLTQARLKEIVTYDPLTGEFAFAPTYKKTGGARDKPGGYGANGYWQIGINRTRHYAHRLAWLYMTGHFPDMHIDHINGNRADNRWANIRLATRAENHQNITKTKKNTSGYLGVCFCKQTGKWSAHIKANGVYRFLGRHTTPKKAAAAYAAAKRELHPFQPTERGST